jgi:hypothetical protein
VESKLPALESFNYPNAAAYCKFTDIVQLLSAVDSLFHFGEDLMMKKHFILSVLLASTLLSACAGTQFKWRDARKINTGMTSEEVIQIMGQPNGIYSQEGKLIYSWYSASLINGNRGIKIEFKDNKVTEAPAVPNSFKD